MNLQPVTSSQIESIGFENNTLAVKFKNGGLYNYSGVPQTTYEAMLKSESVGKFLAQYIKPKFPFKKAG